MCRICRRVPGEDLMEVTELDCGDCPNIREIPYLPSLRALWCNDCSNIREIPQLPSLGYLDCRNCSIRKIPQLPSLQILYCSSCPNICEIPQLPSLQVLYCGSCPNIREIPQLLNLQRLDCIYCPNLREISQLPNLRYLECIYCLNLREISQLPNLRYLDCRGCPLLTTDNELTKKHINIIENKERVKCLQTLCQKIKQQECLKWLIICNSVSERDSAFYKVPIDVIRIINEMCLQQKWDISAYDCGEFFRESVEWELSRG